MKEDVVAANLANLRQSIKELSVLKNRILQSLNRNNL